MALMTFKLLIPLIVLISLVTPTAFKIPMPLILQINIFMLIYPIDLIIPNLNPSNKFYNPI